MSILCPNLEIIECELFYILVTVIMLMIPYPFLPVWAIIESELCIITS